MNTCRPFVENFLRDKRPDCLWRSKLDSPTFPLMTVCIGVVCMDGRAVVMAADRQFTHPSFKFSGESPERKIAQLSPHHLLATAGEPPDSGILEESRIALSDKQTAGEVADLIYKACTRQWHRRMGQAVTQIQLNMDYDRYMEELKSGRIDQKVADRIKQETVRVPANRLFLLGASDDRGAHLCAIAEKEGSSALDSPGFTAIGAGDCLAYSILFRKPNARLGTISETIYLAYEAKKMAENCPSVGKGTDMAVLIAGQNAQFLSKEAIAQLEEIYNSKEPPSLTKSEIESIQALLPTVKT